MGTALITGGSKRIGKAIALSLAERGYHIALHYRSSKKAAEAVQLEINKKGVECHLFQCDLQDIQAVKDLLLRVIDRFPDTTLLINSASVFERAGLMDTDVELFDRHFNTNFKAPFFLTQSFSKHCSEGHVINLLDTKISRTLVEYFVYTLTKKTLYEFTRMAAKELAPCIRVNGVCPGLILPSSEMSEKEFERQGEHLPLHRTGNPGLIVSAVLFFLDNPFVTGEVLFIDGGEHLKA